MKPYLKVTSDFTKEFTETIKKFKNDDILIGIPQSESARDDEQINNASLLAIHEFGAPSANIPARPVLSIGLKNARPEITELFKQGAIDALTKGISALAQIYERIGIVASNSVKKAINSQEGIEPPSEATLAARKAKGFKGTKALIVTGQMRNAITYVVRSKVG